MQVVWNQSLKYISLALEFQYFQPVTRDAVPRHSESWRAQLEWRRTRPQDKFTVTSKYLRLVVLPSSVPHSTMPLGVEPLFIRSSVNLARRLQTRLLCSSAVRSSNNSQPYHTYFQHDSPVVFFPENSKIPRYSGSSHSTRSREPTVGEGWLIFLGGFITFPIFYFGYYWGNWAFGSKLSKAEIKQLEQQGLAQGSRGLGQRPQIPFKDAENLYNILQRANAETKALHDLILLWINSDHGLHAVKDNQILRKNPIKMSTGRQLDPGKAILIRIMDKNSKTLVLLLGVDTVGHSSSTKEPEMAWCQDQALKEWMNKRAQELRQSGEAADQGISLYCYTKTSSATSLSGKKGEMWQEARLFPEDLPERFPLSVLESVKDEVQSDAS